MKSRDGLILALLTLLSNNTTLILAQYVTTVTVSINDNPFCTPINRIGALGGSSIPGSGASGMNGSGADASGPAQESDGSNGPGSGTSVGSASNGSLSALPVVDTKSGRWDALGWYAVPADGRLLNGPISNSPIMTLELCGTNCEGYTYLALEKGNECNCGSSAPSSPVSSSSPSKNKRQAPSNQCTPCAGNNAECCGAPGGYALVYHFTPYVEGSSVITYSSTTSAGSIIKASSTAYSPISSPSIIAYTSTGSDGSIAVVSSTSYGAIMLASPYFSSTINLAGPAGVTTSTTSSAPTGSSSGSGSGFGTVSSNSGLGIISYSSSILPDTGMNSIISITGSNPTLRDSSTVAFSAASTSTAANGGASGATETTVNGGNSGATGTTENAGVGATTAADNGGGPPEPTVTATLSCAKSSNYASNNTKYNDYNGYTYDIRCNLDIQSVPSDYDAHADNFEDCLEYCSFLTDCIAVTYQDPPNAPNNSSNCFPKWSFGGYTTSVADGVYSGVNVNGPSPGTLEDQNLCTANNTQGESYDGTTYYDDFGSAWTIGCDKTVPISAVAALSNTVTDTLASCVDYCSVYETCEMVNWAGPHARGTLNEPNCFPASSAGTAGAPGSAAGSAYAVLNP